MTPDSRHLSPPKAGQPSVAAGSSHALFLSIIMPVHNEQASVARCVRGILELNLPCPFELLAIDDGSTDETAQILSRIGHPHFRLHNHAINKGKGAAVLTGLKAAKGSYVLIFDADAEYSPDDIPKLLDPIIKGRASVVYGTRMSGNHTVYGSLRYAVGNRLLTLAANVLYDSWLSDLHTCLKLLPRELLRQLRLTQAGFGLDTELTGEILRRGIRPYEVPVSYVARSRSEGKKISWRDGIDCLRILLTVRARGRACLSSGSLTPELTLVRDDIDLTAREGLDQDVYPLEPAAGLVGISAARLNRHA